MAWVKSVGKRIKDIILLSNPDYVCTTYNSGTIYTMIEPQMTFYNSSGYATDYTETPLIDISNYNVLTIQGNCYMQGQQQSSGNSVMAALKLIDSNGNVVTTFFSDSFGWQTPSASHTLNVAYDISGLSGYYKVRMESYSWYPNYVRFSYTKFEFNK